MIFEKSSNVKHSITKTIQGYIILTDLTYYCISISLLFDFIFDLLEKNCSLKCLPIKLF